MSSNFYGNKAILIGHTLSKIFHLTVSGATSFPAVLCSWRHPSSWLGSRSASFPGERGPWKRPRPPSRKRKHTREGDREVSDHSLWSRHTHKRLILHLIQEYKYSSGLVYCSQSWLSESPYRVGYESANRKERKKQQGWFSRLGKNVIPKVRPLFFRVFQNRPFHRYWIARCSFAWWSYQLKDGFVSTANTIS